MWWVNGTTCPTQTMASGLGSGLYNCLGTNTSTTSATQSIWQQQAANQQAYYNATQGVQDVTPTQYYALAQGRVAICRERTEEEARRYAEQLAEAQRQQAERTAAYERVKQRSREMLLAHLTKAQRQAFIDLNWFIVEGGKSETPYRIRTGHAGNIDVLDKKTQRVLHRLCCHCSHDIPVYDNMLAQKITLQFDEDTFLRLANRQAA